MADQKSDNKGVKIFVFILVLVIIAIAIFLFFRKEAIAPSSDVVADKTSVENSSEPAENDQNVDEVSQVVEDKPVITESAEDPLKKYDKTYVSYISDNSKIRGTAGISYSAYGDKRLSVVFNMYVNELPPKDGNYVFAGKLIGTDGLEVKGSLISARYCGYDYIAYPFGIYYEDVYKCGGGVPKTYYVTFQYKTNNYEDLMKFNSLEIWKNDSQSFDYDMDKLFEKGKKFVSYSFDFSKEPLEYEYK